MTPFLFSIDVEDPGRPEDPNGSRMPRMVETWLRFLDERGAKATFFVLGESAERHRSTVADIAAEGHEIGCHSHRHLSLAEMGEAGFRDDLSRALDALAAAGAGPVTGYRAPCLSMSAETRWAYAVLGKAGIAYSSSVLPARNPLHGWRGFGRTARMLDGVLEMPVTLLPWRLASVPAAAGVYFRTLPWPILSPGLNRLQRDGEALLGYFHPYDIDAGEEPFAFPGFSRWSPFNLAMFAGRGRVLARLDCLLAMGFEMAPYGPEARRLAAER